MTVFHLQLLHSITGNGRIIQNGKLEDHSLFQRNIPTLPSRD